MLPCMLLSVLIFLRLFRNLFIPELGYAKLVSFSLNIIIVGWIGGILASKLDYLTQSTLTLRPTTHAYLKFAFDGQRWYASLFFSVAYITFFISRELSIKNYFLFLDRASLILCFFFIIGKIDCFLSGHIGGCGGKETILSWGIIMPYKRTPTHPRQLYDAIFHLFLFIILFFIYKKKPESIGLISIFFLTSTVIYSFCSEFLSTNEIVFLGLRTAQFGYLLTFVLVAYNFSILRKLSSQIN
jgi:prolipoprotein diacylglyceryltransferase